MFNVTWIRSLAEEAGKSMSESTHSSGKRFGSQAFEIAWLGFRARPGTCWEELTFDRTLAKIAAARIRAKATTIDDTRSFFLLRLTWRLGSRLEPELWWL